MKIVKLSGLTFILVFVFSSIFGQLEWTPYKGEIPSNAVIGGIENNVSLAVCRAELKGGVHPGKALAGNCNIGYGGAEYEIPTFDILVNNGHVQLDWEKTNGKLPENAIKGGTENGNTMYVGRAHRDGITHPGKVFQAGYNYICNYGYGGEEVTQKVFEVLVEHPADPDYQHISHDPRCLSNEGGHLGLSMFVGTMSKNQGLREGFYMVSRNINYGLRVTDGGRLVVEDITDHVICDSGHIIVFSAEEIWSNPMEEGDPSLDYYVVFQEDENLCIYSEQNGFVWCSMSHGQNGAHVELTNKGHLEVVNDHGVEIWPD